MGESLVSCLIKRPGNQNPLGVCTQKIYTGLPPLPVQDFACLSENWKNLNCTWRLDPNPVETNYTVEFWEPGSRTHRRSCTPLDELEDRLGRPVPKHSCYLDMETIPHYRQTLETYYFYFKRANRLRPEGLVQNFTVKPWTVMKPGPPVSLDLASLSPSELLLSYNVSKELGNFG